MIGESLRLSFGKHGLPGPGNSFDRGSIVILQNIENSQLDELVVTDSIPLREDAVNCDKIRPLSIAGLLAETMRRISNEESVSSLFVD